MCFNQTSIIFNLPEDMKKTTTTAATATNAANTKGWLLNISKIKRIASDEI